MILKRHKGPDVKQGGVIIKESDYEGQYALHVITENGEEHEYSLSAEQVERINTLTEDPIGQCETGNNLLDRVKGAFNGE